MKDAYGKIYRLGSFASFRLYDRKAWPKAINRITLGGLEMWRFHPSGPTRRIETHRWPWRDTKDSPIVSENKIFVLFCGRVYAVAWKSKRPMVPAMQFHAPANPKTGDRP